MVKGIVWVCLMSLWIVGCGGGGGEMPPEAVNAELERAMAFHDAALELVRAHIVVTCERIECPWVSGGASVRQGEDREQSVCVHGCVAVELPGEQPGEVETRFFLVEHVAPDHMKVDTYGKPYLHTFYALISD